MMHSQLPKPRAARYPLPGMRHSARGIYNLIKIAAATSTSFPCLDSTIVVLHSLIFLTKRPGIAHSQCLLFPPRPSKTPKGLTPVCFSMGLPRVRSLLPALLSPLFALSPVALPLRVQCDSQWLPAFLAQTSVSWRIVGIKRNHEDFTDALFLAPTLSGTRIYIKIHTNNVSGGP